MKPIYFFCCLLFGNILLAQEALLLPIYEGKDTIIFYNEDFEKVFQVERQKLVFQPYFHELTSPIICKDKSDEQHIIVYDAQGNVLFERDSVHQVIWQGFQDGICSMVIGTPYDNKTDWVDEEGCELPAFNGKNVVTKFSDGLALYTYGETTGNYLKCGVIDSKGKPKSACKFYLKNNKSNDNFHFYYDIYFKEGLCPMPDNKALAAGRNKVLYGYINAKGQYKIKARFRAAMPFSEGLAAVQDVKTELWGYIDKSGKYIIQPRFARAAPFKDGVAIVRKVEFGSDLINRQGTFLDLKRNVNSYNHGLMSLDFHFIICNPPSNLADVSEEVAHNIICSPSSYLADISGEVVHKSPFTYQARALTSVILVESNSEKGYPYIRYVNLKTGAILKSNYAKNKLPPLHLERFFNDF